MISIVFFEFGWSKQYLEEGCEVSFFLKVRPINDVRKLEPIKCCCYNLTLNMIPCAQMQAVEAIFPKLYCLVSSLNSHNVLYSAC